MALVPVVLPRSQPEVLSNAPDVYERSLALRVFPYFLNATAATIGMANAVPALVVPRGADLTQGQRAYFAIEPRSVPNIKDTWAAATAFGGELHDRVLVRFKVGAPAPTWSVPRVPLRGRQLAHRLVACA